MQEFEKKVECDVCSGDGQIEVDECGVCGGDGYQENSETYSFLEWKHSPYREEIGLWLSSPKDDDESNFCHFKSGAVAGVRSCHVCAGRISEGCEFCAGIGRVIEFSPACPSCKGGEAVVTNSFRVCEGCDGTGLLILRESREV
jgi:DnaJ-class molecular chaperone